MKKIFYVRGLIVETTPTVVMLLAEDKNKAALRATDYGLSGKMTVIEQDDWDGCKKRETLIIGFAT